MLWYCVQNLQLAEQSLLWDKQACILVQEPGAVYLLGATKCLVIIFGWAYISGVWKGKSCVSRVVGSDFRAILLT